jgi:long-subunit fatty acid transport protein
MNIVNNGYFGHLLNIRINPTLPALGFNGEMVSASDFFKATQNKELEDATKDKYVDCDQSGWGVTPLIGFNFNWKNLNIGMKYEFKTNLNVENKTKVDGTGLFNNGVNTPHDIPALFTVGASYNIIPQVTVSAGYHHFFDSDAKMANDKQKYINGGTNEYLGGVEWRINNMFLISAGGQSTRQGVTDDYQTDMSFALNSYSIGFGGAVNVSESVRINIGYFFTNYDDWTKQSSNYNGTPLPGTDVFSRTNKVFGAGVDFRF